MEAEFGRTQRAPADAIARAVEAAERAFQPLHIGQQRVFTHLDIVHDDHAGGRCAQAQLTLDLRRTQPLHPLFQHEAANAAAMRLALGPDDEDIGERRVGNPCLAAVEHIAAVDLLRDSAHPRRIAAGVGLGQAETADQRARRQPGQIFAALFFGAIFMDREHDEARLHRRHRAIARIHPLDFAGDQAIGHIVGTRAAVGFRDGRAEQPGLPHQREQFGRVDFIGERLDHTRLQFALGKGMRRIADHPLLIAELVIDEKGVRPIEPAHARHLSLLLSLRGDPCPARVRRLLPACHAGV